MASSGGVTSVIPGNLHNPPHVPSRGARRRLRSVVDGVGAFVARRRPPVSGASHPLDGLPAAALAAPGTAGRDVPPLPTRPGPVDKPAAVAHYQAMAERVARERALAELDDRRRALRDGVGASRHLWVAGVGAGAKGDPRHG